MRHRLALVDVLVVTGLVAVAAWAASPGLAPSSLWLDDAWHALVTRADGPAEVLLVAVTAPGYTFLLAGILAITGMSELAVQAPAYLAYVACGPALYLLAVRRGLPRPAALLGAGVLLASPVLVVYATRVKQYTTDALLVVILLTLAWDLIREPGRARRWWVYVGTSLAAVSISAAVAPVAASGLATGWSAALRVALARPDRGDAGGGDVDRSQGAGWATPVLATLVWSAISGAWYVLLTRSDATEELRSVWAEHYVRLDDLPVLADDTIRLVGAMLEGALAAPPLASATVLLIALIVVAVRRLELAVLLSLPLISAYVLAMLELVPLGTGRIDAHLHPVLAFTVMFAVAGVLPGPQVRTGATPPAGGGAPVQPDLRTGVEPSWRARALAWVGCAVLAVGLLSATLVSTDRTYPQEDLRPLVGELESRAADEDGVIVYPSAVWAYALYASGEVELVPAQEANGFRPTFDDPRVTVLGRHRDRPQAYRSEVRRAAEDRRRVWLIATHIRDDLAVIEEHLADAGFARTGRWDRPGAQLTLWERS